MADHLQRVRAAYDTVAVDYELLIRDHLAAAHFDRAALNTFAELVGRGGAVADVGCGPGRITEYLQTRGLIVRGIDLSPGMVGVARGLHPELQFEVGTMAALALPDGSLDGLVAWYSIIHTPPEELSGVFGEFARVLRPGGQLLLAFQVGDEPRQLTHAYGHDIDLDAWRLAPERIAAELESADLHVHAQTVRDPAELEKSPQAILYARRS
ncbi:class I SAM-dependent methyltransferase [Jatrophihabitans sp.]|uniref:class I SAM-dependent methyltransferase n=1 Tax=Jatrophihabitans sp. TaxID=1932789 RepID=UPI0030C65E8E|nr:methyltransferase [Jatrophihabitans sp.]